MGTTNGLHEDKPLPPSPSSSTPSTISPTSPSPSSSSPSSSSPTTRWVHPFADLLAHALTAQHLTLERVAHRLRVAGTPVSESTLSNWRRGQALPRQGADHPAVAELERLLSLAPGALAMTLQDPAPQAHSAQAVFTMMVLEVDVPTGVIAVATRHVVEAVGEVGEIAAWEHTLAAYSETDEPTSVGPPQRTVLGRSTAAAAFRPGVVTTTIRAPEPLLAGQAHTASWRHTHVLPAGGARIEHVVTDLLQPAVIVMARFHGLQPATVHAYRAEAPESIVVASEPLTPLNHRYQAVFRNSRTGVCGLRWTAGRR